MIGKKPGDTLNGGQLPVRKNTCVWSSGVQLCEHPKLDLVGQSLKPPYYMYIILFVYIMYICIYHCISFTYYLINQLPYITDFLKGLPTLFPTLVDPPDSQVLPCVFPKKNCRKKPGSEAPAEAGEVEWLAAPAGSPAVPRSRLRVAARIALPLGTDPTIPRSMRNCWIFSFWSKKGCTHFMARLWDYGKNHRAVPWGSPGPPAPVKWPEPGPGVWGIRCFSCFWYLVTDKKIEKSLEENVKE